MTRGYRFPQLRMHFRVKHGYRDAPKVDLQAMTFTITLYVYYDVPHH